MTNCQYYIQQPVFIDNNVNLKDYMWCGMLLCMDNEPKIFAAWLKKFIKDDKKITARALAKKISCDPTTISSYIRGRTQAGYDVRTTILDITNVTKEEMIAEGKAALEATKQNKPEIEKRLSELEKRLSQGEESHKIDITTERHRKVINNFKDKDMALKLNEMLLEIEKMDSSALKEAETILSLLKIKVEQETQNTKKRTANGED